jgi:hypothetical protein
MSPECRTDDAAERDLDELLAELDVFLDAWFLGEVQPALEEARRARAATDG